MCSGAVAGGHRVATRRNFTQECKDQAVSIVLDSGRSIVEGAWWTQLQRPMQPLSVVVHRIAGKHAEQVSVAEDQHAVG